MSSPGSLVAFWQDDELRVVVVVAEDSRRVRGIDADGRERRFAVDRIALDLGFTGEAQDRRAAADSARRAEHSLHARSAEVDVELLWEIVISAGEPGASFEAADLAELALGSREEPDEAALLLALKRDGLRFQRRGRIWSPRDAGHVADLELQRQRAVEREQATGALFEALREAARGGGFAESGNETETRYLHALEQLAIHDDAAPEKLRELAVAALRASGLRFDRPGEGAFRLLRCVGRFESDDENLQLRRYGIRVDFPEPVLRAACRSVERGFDREGREDLRELTTISIDGPDTREIDDALSLERVGDRWRLGVHIADPGAFTLPGDPVDEEALRRGLTHYHPELRVPMLPPPISEGAASLVAGEERPALSFLIDLDDEGRVVERRVTYSFVRCSERLDYSDADRRKTEDSTIGALLVRLGRLAETREELRRQHGAILIDAPEVDVHVDAGGSIRLERLEAGSPSRRIVTESMILAGESAGRIAVEAGLPVIFRRQVGPTTALEVPPGGARDPVAIRQLRRQLQRAETTAQPARHAGLGLDLYVQATSPLRRFLDLVVQRQLGAYAAGRQLPYDAAAIGRIVASTDQAEIDARRAERARNDYWLLRFLEGQTGASLDAVVVEVEPRPVVQLDQTQWEQAMPSLAGARVGERVRVRVERVNPRASLLVLRRVD